MDRNVYSVMMHELPPTFAGLWDTWYARIFTYTREFSGLCYQDREELTQDILFKAWTKKDSYRPEWAPATWIYRLARNLCIDTQRKVQRSQGKQEALDEAQGASPVYQPENHFASLESSREVRNAVETLEQTDRELLYLIYSEEQSFREAALILGTPEGTLKSRLSRARAKLRTILEVES